MKSFSSMSEVEAEKQSEYNAVKQLLKQVYAAHVAKVKDLECEVRHLTQQLEEARKKALQKFECEKCKEMQSAFNACKEYKNALLEQTNRLRELEKKFSTIENNCLESKSAEPTKEVPDSTKIITELGTAESYNTDALTFSHWDDAVAEVEELQLAQEVSVENMPSKKSETPNGDTEQTSDKKAFNKTLLNRRKIFSDESCEAQSPSSQLATPVNGANDDVVLVPDSLDVSLVKKPRLSSLSSKRLKKNKPVDFSSPDNKENDSCISSVIRIEKNIQSKKRALADLALDHTQNKRFTSEQPKESSIKKESDMAVEKVVMQKDVSSESVSREKPEVLSRNSNKEEASKKENSNLEISKKALPKKTVKDLLKEAEGWASNFEDFDVESAHLQQSLSVISGNKTTKCDLQTIDEDFLPSSTASRTDEHGAWKSSVKRNSQKKALAIKPIKCTSRFKMTLEAPNASWKKPNFKQTKLSKSIFLNKNSQKLGSQENRDNSEQCSSPAVNLDEKTGDSSTMCGVSELASLASLDYTCIPGDLPSPSKLRPQLATQLSPHASSDTNRVEETMVCGNGSKQCEGNGTDADPKASHILVMNEEEESNDAPEEVDHPPGDCNSFDRLPVPEEPNYKYKEDAIRGKSKRKQLVGFECKECEKYYSELGLSEEEMKERMQQCSKHRAKFIPPQTPEHFWELDFPDTEECKARGYVAATQKVQLKSRRRRPLASE